MGDPLKVRENRLRRVAARRGLVLRKSRRRDVDAVDYGQYWLTDLRTNLLILGDEWGWELDDIELWLREHGAARPSQRAE